MIEVINEWLYDECIDINEASNDDFFVEEFEHAATIRWGSKEGDFPRLAHSILSGDHSVIMSGEMINGVDVVADLGSKLELNLEQLAYKYLLEDLMRDCEKGYELNEVKTPDGDVFKIRVEKIKSGQSEKST